MREIIYNTDIDKQAYEYKACMQGDSLKIILNVYNNGSQYDLTGAKAILNFAKPDGTPVTKADNITVENNTISCILNEEYTNTYGKAKFEFEINKDGKTTTFPLELIIAEKVFQGSVVNNKIVELLNLVKIDEAIDDFMDGIKKEITSMSSEIAENTKYLENRIDNIVVESGDNPIQIQDSLTDVTNKNHDTLNQRLNSDTDFILGLNKNIIKLNYNSNGEVIKIEEINDNNETISTTNIEYKDGIVSKVTDKIGINTTITTFNFGNNNQLEKIIRS